MYPLCFNIFEKHYFCDSAHRLHSEMIYLDNAATSRFKPKCVTDALIFDLAHSANAGRSGHSESVKKTLATEDCRAFLTEKLGGKDDFELIFTKNCTEALNLAIFGSVKRGDKVVTTKNEHNSVLRPLYKLKNDGVIDLQIATVDESGRVDYADLKEKAKGANLIAVGGACNVTGAIVDMDEIGKIAKSTGAKLLVDGAQSVPCVDTDMQRYGVDMLALPAHKGLHGVQGVGALAVRKGTQLAPLLFGGTGARSNELAPEIIFPESFEAGTQFSGGISALHQGAKWTFDNLQKIRKNTVRLSKNLVYALKNIGAKVYTRDFATGVVSFNIDGVDSGYIADYLDEYGVCVRAGLHCAPLVHEHLHTLDKGAVRASIGCDNTDKEINAFVTLVENFARKLRDR